MKTSSKIWFLGLFCGLSLFLLGGCGGGGGGGSAPHPADRAVSVTNKGNYYEIVLNYNEGFSPFEVGQEYGRKVLVTVPGYESALDSYLAELAEKTDFLYQLFLSRAEEIRKNLDATYLEELEGFADNLITENKLGDGRLSVDEFFLLNLVPDVARATACNALAVWGNRSVTGKTQLVRNLEWFSGSQEQLSRVNAVTVVKNGTRSYAMVGYVGMLGMLTGFNSRGVFAAVLDSQTGSEYSYTGCRSYTFDLRRAVENAAALGDVADDMRNPQRSYTVNHLIFLADGREARVLENNFRGPGTNVSRRVRTVGSETNPGFNPGIAWGIDESIAAVNSFILLGNTDNHTPFPTNAMRWSSMATQLRLAGELVTGTELKAVASYSSTGKPGNRDQGDLYSTHTAQLLYFCPETLELEAFFRKPSVAAPLPDKPTFQAVPVKF